MEKSYKFGSAVVLGVALAVTGGCGEPPRNKTADYQASESYRAIIKDCVQRTLGNEENCKLAGMAGMPAWQREQEKLQKNPRQ